MNERQVNGSNINVFYSTPSCYLKALHDSDSTWPAKQDDFFPYASTQHTYWTGYFTSRPSLKLFERFGNGYLQVCKQLSVLSPKKGKHFEENLTNLREAMGVLQHHDSVSGTEQQHVANDYARLLQIGINKCSENIKDALNQLKADKNGINVESRDVDSEFEYAICPNLNISSCQITEENDKFMITLYNPLAHSTSQYVRVPVTQGEYVVKDSLNATIDFQLVSIPSEVQSLEYRRSDSFFELVFLASDLPPIGFKSYFVEQTSIAFDNLPTDEILDNFTIGNEHLNVTFEDGLMAAVANKNVKMKVKQNFYVYPAAGGFSNNASGAYSFRPNVTKAFEIADTASVKVIRGAVVDEVHQVRYLLSI